MKTITKKQFLSDVRHEIEMLKVHATGIEKNKLDFDDFDPQDPDCCIYGQMTGYCRSDRAKELMDLACIRVVENDMKNEFKTWDRVKICVNGGYTGQMYQNRTQFSHLSTLEAYIYMEEAKSEAIIAYIKGETSTLTL